MPVKVLADLRCRLDPLARPKSPLGVPPPRSTRFGSPLVLSRVHWVEPKLVTEITYLTWTADDLLRHTVYVGLREDKPAEQVRREALKNRWPPRLKESDVEYRCICINIPVPESSNDSAGRVDRHGQALPLLSRRHRAVEPRLPGIHQFLRNYVCSPWNHVWLLTIGWLCRYEPFTRP
jgi:ATP dependent DNA ligase C terminal region